mmetsp:Transcript_40212/g.86220  ORF Transcript_40212/g.86220 Transcript_40212/m.86220 type:complete len:294 (-) Transcript_40212:655-1536(-)
MMCQRGLVRMEALVLIWRPLSLLHMLLLLLLLHLLHLLMMLVLMKRLWWSLLVLVLLVWVLPVWLLQLQLGWLPILWLNIVLLWLVLIMMRMLWLLLLLFLVLLHVRRQYQVLLLCLIALWLTFWRSLFDNRNPWLPYLPHLSVLLPQQAHLSDQLAHGVGQGAHLCLVALLEVCRQWAAAMVVRVWLRKRTQIWMLLGLKMDQWTTLWHPPLYWRGRSTDRLGWCFLKALRASDRGGAPDHAVGVDDCRNAARGGRVRHHFGLRMLGGPLREQGTASSADDHSWRSCLDSHG